MHAANSMYTRRHSKELGTVSVQLANNLQLQDALNV